MLHEAGGVPADLISLRIYVTDKKQYVARTKELGVIYREIRQSLTDLEKMFSSDLAV